MTISSKIELPSTALAREHACDGCPHSFAYTERRNDVAKQEGKTSCQMEKSSHTVYYDHLAELHDQAAGIIGCKLVEKELPSPDSLPEFGTHEWGEFTRQCPAHKAYVNLRNQGL